MPRTSQTNKKTKTQMTLGQPKSKASPTNRRLAMKRPARRTKMTRLARRTKMKRLARRKRSTMMILPLLAC